ncbi:hypothetical protein, partial [Nocardia abscessus]|uniref:hypothetical protein n=1 Tax=Nocardia abscessus TaxID=120957 RepID=UPI002457D7F5
CSGYVDGNKKTFVPERIPSDPAPQEGVSVMLVRHLDCATMCPVGGRGRRTPLPRWSPRRPRAAARAPPAANTHTSPKEARREWRTTPLPM